MINFRSCRALCLISLCLLYSFNSQAKTISTQSEVIAIGDVHGAYAEFVSLLTEIGLVDDDANWSGGNKHLVSLGDLVDRGKDSRQVIELVMKLTQQAQEAGGAVSLVFGNHEIMLMTGDFRYVSNIEFAAYENLETKVERQLLFERFKAINPNSDDVEQDFEDTYPKGFNGLVNAFSPQGHIGKWLRANGVSILKINDTIYVHGGVSAQTLKRSLTEINEKGRELLNDYDQLSDVILQHGFLPYSVKADNGLLHINNRLQEKNAKDQPWFDSGEQLLRLQDSMLFAASGPFWYRGNANCPELSESFTLDDMQIEYDASHVVVGHTVKYRRLMSRVNGKVILADTGMLAAYYNGTPTAVFIDEKGIAAHHLKGKFTNTIRTENARFRANPLGMSDADVEAFLQEADIIENKAIGKGITNSRVLTLKQGDIQLRASFKTFDDSPNAQNKKRFSRLSNDYDRYIYEVAAYKIDRLIGQMLVPPAVLREIDGKKGTVQLWVDDVFTENNRIDKRMVYTGMCPIIGSLRMRLIFDTLIYNIDRNNGNILWDQDYFVTFIDHSQAFGTSIKQPKNYRRSKIRLSSLYKDKLNALTEEILINEVGDFLHPKQIEAIIKRRDYLLKKKK